MNVTLFHKHQRIFRNQTTVKIGGVPTNTLLFIILLQHYFLCAIKLEVRSSTAGTFFLSQQPRVHTISVKDVHTFRIVGGTNFVILTKGFQTNGAFAHGGRRDWDVVRGGRVNWVWFIPLIIVSVPMRDGIGRRDFQGWRRLHLRRRLLIPINDVAFTYTA